MSNILVIEDDPDLGRLLVRHLAELGHEPDIAADGETGLERARSAQPDLLLLDVMLPGVDGWEVLNRLRLTSSVPVLILTARVGQEDVIRGLELGADDYLRKPFDLRELDLRIEALLRRAHGIAPGLANVYDDGVLHIDVDRRVVTRRGQPVRLAPTEFRLLAYLIAHPGQAMTHAELLREVWGPEYLEDTPVLSVYIRYLREKLEDAPGEPLYIRTEWGSGYRFQPRLPST